LQHNILIEKYFWQNDENSPPKISLSWGLKHGVFLGRNFADWRLVFFHQSGKKNLVFFEIVVAKYRKNILKL